MIQLSVVLPIYNGENTLSNTLDSLLAQTYQDFEVLACIDGSADGSEDLLNQYIGRFKKITILKNPKNRGLGPTMNRLVSEAQGEYIAVAEQDDYYVPERLKLQVDLLNNNATIGMVSGIAEFWNGQRVTGQFPGMLAKGQSYPEGVEMFLLNYRNHLKVVNSCMMFRKSVHVENGLYFTQHYPSISVDWTYVLRFSLVSNIYGLNTVLVRLDRRANRDSVTSKKTQQYKATRELLRSFAYEFPDIVSDGDYGYAMRTQNLLETNRKSRYAYISSWLRYFIKNPFEKRYLDSLKKRLFSKLK